VVVDPEHDRMTQLLQQIGEQRVAAFILVLGRLTPLFVLAPMFSSKLVPMRVRGVVAVALAVGISPIAARHQTLPLDLWHLAGLTIKELIVGLCFAFVIGALFAAISVAGSLLDTLSGFAYGAQIDPVNGNQSAVLSNAYSLIAVLIFIAIGGDGWVIEGLARTYNVVGLNSWPQLGGLVAGVDTAFVGIFSAAIEVAGPVILALILTDAAVGVVSRVVPQLNVFAVGLPAKVMVALLLIGATLPFVGGWLSDTLQQDVVSALQAIRVA
jgi:flagellar biosynthetic protein FliR